MASALQQLPHHMLRCHSESQSSSCCTPKSTPEDQQQEGRAAAPCRRPGDTEQLYNQNCTKLICPDLLSLRPTSCRSTWIGQGHMTTDCSTKYLERFKIKISHNTHEKPADCSSSNSSKVNSQQINVINKSPQNTHANVINFTNCCVVSKTL